MTQPLIKDNLSLLDQARLVASNLNPDEYLQVGAHFRHVIEHYSLFLSNFAGGMVDYDRRDRSNLCGTSTEAFLAQLEDVVASLRTMDLDPAASVAICCATCPNWQQSSTISTVGRELMFLHSHTTHHLALISMKLQIAGLPISPDIGVAPSTKRYQLKESDRLNI